MGNLWNWILFGGGGSLLAYCLVHWLGTKVSSLDLASALAPPTSPHSNPQASILDLPAAGSSESPSRDSKTPPDPTSTEAFESWLVVQRYLRAIGVGEEAIEAHRRDLAPLIMQEVPHGDE